MNTKLDNQETECQQASDALVAHFDGAANEAEKQLATAHLAHCSTCAQMWSEWQSLRLMEQRALEPVAPEEMLPLAPVIIPRHLKSAILRQTVSTPIWERFWPRLLSGMAVPTVALGCWLLVVAAPWQQSVMVINSPSDHRNVALSQKPHASTPPKIVNNNSSKTTVTRPEKSTSTIATNAVVAHSANNNSSHSVRQIESKSVAAANESSAKSTFKAASRPNNSRSETVIVKPPQISMASFNRPFSRAANHLVTKTARPIAAVAPKLRVTKPVLIAYLPAQDMANSTDTSSDPMYNYITNNDVRPDEIRQAVENYRAALLDSSDL